MMRRYTTCYPGRRAVKSVAIETVQRFTLDVARPGVEKPVGEIVLTMMNNSREEQTSS
jgi:hypothetical protein